MSTGQVSDSASADAESEAYAAVYARVIAGPPPTSCIRLVLGASLTRSFWGWAPPDLGAALWRDGRDSLASSKSAGSAGREAGHDEAGHHSYHDDASTFYAVPKRRHHWYQPQYELHASWADLFFDLIYVGAAYQLGVVVKYSFVSCYYDGLPSTNSTGSASYYGRHLASTSTSRNGAIREYGECVGIWLGVLYSLGFFSVLCRLWLFDLYMRNRFDTPDLAHKLLDLVCYFFVAAAASGVNVVHSFDETGLWPFLLPSIAAMVLYMGRMLEVALRSDDIGCRRQASAMLLDALWPLGALLGALVFSQYYLDDRQIEIDSRMRWTVPALLMFVGCGLLWEARQLWRLRRFQYFASEEQVMRFLQVDYPRTRTAVPINVNFTIHRFNEFMMLMLGETVLQLVVAEHPTDVEFAEHYTTLMSGFIMCVCMMYSFK